MFNTPLKVNTEGILRENINAERVVKWRRIESTVEMPCTQVYTDGSVMIFSPLAQIPCS